MIQLEQSHWGSSFYETVQTTTATVHMYLWESSRFSQIDSYKYGHMSVGDSCLASNMFKVPVIGGKTERESRTCLMRPVCA